MEQGMENIWTMLRNKTAKEFFKQTIYVGDSKYNRVKQKL